MTYPSGPDHAHSPNRPDLPDDIDATGVPTEAAGRETFIILIAAFVAIVALIVTVGFLVINQLGVPASGQSGDGGVPTRQVGPSDGGATTAGGSGTTN